MARVVGIGGILIKLPNPDAVKRWYIDILGALNTADSGIMFPIGKRPKQSYTVPGSFDGNSTYFQPSTREFTLNPVVDNLPGLLARVSPAGDIEEYQFGWFLDPYGTNVELSEPA